MNRRSFFRKAFGLAGAALCWPVAKVLGKTRGLTLADIRYAKEILDEDQKLQEEQYIKDLNNNNYFWYQVNGNVCVRMEQ